MDYLPLFFELTNRPCLVVGGGEVAFRKAQQLSNAGAKLTLVAPHFCTNLTQMAVEDGSVSLICQRFDEEQMDRDSFRLVISATNDHTVNSQVAAAAERRAIPVNVVDTPELCSFIFPAIIDRSPIIAAVSSGGASPVLARLLRGRIESTIPTAYGQLARLAERFRPQVKAAFATITQRRRFWEEVLEGRVAELVFANRPDEAEQQLASLLSDRANQPAETVGEVYLVGAGPGDPDLLTFRALRLMQQADVVVYDRLVSEGVLALVRRDAEKIYAGKARDQHTMPQQQINQLLAELARSGKRVVRLKGGDPFIFGRGGEEIETLAEQGIPFQIVPGITAASGCASYAGIPLTHRDHAQSCAFVTGHLKDGSIDLDWQRLAVPNQTLVIYMGLLGLRSLCQALIKHGASPDLAAALIERGTTLNQRVITGTLATLPDQVEAETVKAPTLVIVGSVVKLHEKLAWFNTED